MMKKTAGRLDGIGNLGFLKCEHFLMKFRVQVTRTREEDPSCFASLALSGFSSLSVFSASSSAFAQDHSYDDSLSLPIHIGR